ncbi:MAG: hypothetical protein JZU65_19520 [Chlorobium sp.]|jgi:hypothetical protein|nr:hypothetical protein [Chlorobium sp.]
MGLFDFFKSTKNETNISTTGVYTVNGIDLIPLNELPGIGSIVDITESLGFKKWHTVVVDSKKIQCIVFKRRTKEPLIVFANEKTLSISYSDVTKMIKQIDWGAKWRQLDFEDSIK